MSLSSLIRAKKGLFITLSVVIIVFIVVLVALFLSSQRQRCTVHFKSAETNFLVHVPKGWTIIEQPRQGASANAEATPDEGVQLLHNGDDRNSIWIYCQFGTISMPEGDYVQEEFITKQGVTGVLYKDDLRWQLILGQNIAPGFFGASVHFEDKELFDNTEQELVEILKSIEIHEP